MIATLRIVATTARPHRTSKNWHTGDRWENGTYEVVFELSRAVNDLEADLIRQAFENVVSVGGASMVQAGTNAERVRERQDWYQQKLAEIEATAEAHEEQIAQEARERQAVREAQQQQMRTKTEQLKWD